MTSEEKQIKVGSGWAMLPLTALLFLGGIGGFIGTIVAIENRWVDLPEAVVGGVIFAALVALGLAVLTTIGYFTLEPGQARVLLLFGNYVGSVREDGFYWTNPFNTKSLISLRTRNFDGGMLKVNDKRGNPIEISAVVVWRVRDTAQALFDVNDYENYVRIQSESALRHLASCYAYDHGEHEGEITLRGNSEEVAEALTKELQDRLIKAGVEVEEARLNHLAYSPEIAGAMLKRQQAEAVIAARTQIVKGAVDMVSMALADIEKDGIVEMDEERKAAMVSNLLVVLCGESDAKPVINTGTLHR